MCFEEPGSKPTQTGRGANSAELNEGILIFYLISLQAAHKRFFFPCEHFPLHTSQKAACFKCTQ
ncbi:MAG: hypothetical protein Greene07147_831 [Parcubacteria group bacterium Greene0714_7]|nr:MAG: hypothetical protein Greene07147_831 [Parcubacteria group bacterium Greene0714_7]